MWKSKSERKKETSAVLETFFIPFRAFGFVEISIGRTLPIRVLTGVPYAL